jgi:16S rRNA (cytosine967-C5)-methyltransferase
MKLYPNLVAAVALALDEIFLDNSYADQVVERTLKRNERWGARDRRFIASGIYDIVRWYRLYQSCLDLVPKHLNASFALIAVSIVIKGGELPAWKEFEGIDIENIKAAYQKALKIRKLRLSVPDWLDETGAEQLGESVWEKEMSCLNLEADVFLRVNTLRSNYIELQEALHQSDVQIERLHHALFAAIEEPPLSILKRQRLQNTEAYKKGLFEIQDASSQLVAPFLKVEPGMLVIDACAGAGGKALHIACLMRNSGKILAMDVEEKKLRELERRAAHAGISIIETKVITPQVIAHYKGKADRLLLDVPCSGLGVLKRNPDAKWKLTPAFIDEIQHTQARLLREYAVMLKPGGLMVYATCSILPSENEQQVAHFMVEHPLDFTLLKECRIMPSEGFDGFYMALIEKKPTNRGFL